MTKQRKVFLKCVSVTLPSLKAISHVTFFHLSAVVLEFLGFVALQSPSFVVLGTRQGLYKITICIAWLYNNRKKQLQTKLFQVIMLYGIYQGQKRVTNPTNRKNSTKEYSGQAEGTTQ